MNLKGGLAGDPDKESRRLHLHLDEKGLELAPEAAQIPDITPRHECRNVGQHVSESGQKDQAVDGSLSEGRGECKCRQDEHAAQQREDGAYSLDGDDDVGLVWCYAAHDVFESRLRRAALGIWRMVHNNGTGPATHSEQGSPNGRVMHTYVGTRGQGGSWREGQEKLDESQVMVDRTSRLYAEVEAGRQRDWKVDDGRGW